MDRSNKLDRKTLYEIYRACRLCGARAGYKMPIIQNLVKVDDEEIELKQKIRECLQLEVNCEDKMPPLICESCSNKLDDFYDFLTKSREVNANTRKRLGLPLQDAPTLAKVIPAPVKVTPGPAKVTPIVKKVVSKDIGTDTCMLGLIEASAVKQDIYIVGKSEAKNSKRSNVRKEDYSEYPDKPENPSTQSPTLKDIKLTKDTDVKQAKEKDNKRKREPSPKRIMRKKNSLDELLMTKIQESPKNLPAAKPGPKSRKIVTKDDTLPPKSTRAKEKEDPPPKLTKKEDETSKSKVNKERDDEPLTKLKRVREKDSKTDLTPPPSKKAKSSDPPKPIRSQKPSKPHPKTIQTATTASKNVQPEGVPCPACNSVLKTTAGFKNHMHYVHPVTWTPDNLACNACREWFPSIDESVAHHKKHQYYKCLRCKKKFKNGVLYHQHVENKRCLPDVEIPDVECESCLRSFPTGNLLKQHRCQGPDGRQGGKCSKCNRKFTLLKNLTKHETTCMFKKKVEVRPVIDPEVKEMLLPMEVRITKCDDLLQYGPVVSACTVPHRHGLDRKMSYPYMPKLRVIKQPTFDPMVLVQDEIKEEFNTDEFNWADFEDIEVKTVKKLSTLCLKVIFSSEMLGDLEIYDEIEMSRRSALKKRIDSIIYKFDDASSTNSDSILDKNALAKTFEVINDKFGSEDNNHNSDSTVFDETTTAEEEGKDSITKIDSVDRDFVNINDNSVNLDVENDKIDNHTLNSNVLSKTDVNIDNIRNNSIVNMNKLSNEYLGLSKTLRDQVTNESSSILSLVNEDKLENSDNEVDNLKIFKNPTDIVIDHNTSLHENIIFDNNRHTNDSPSVIDTENSTNIKDSTIVTENDDILPKNDVDPKSSEDTGTNMSENAIITENTVIGNETLQNNESNVDSESTIDKNSKIEHLITSNGVANSLNNCEGNKSYDVNESKSNDYSMASKESRDEVVKSNYFLTNHDKAHFIDSDLTGNISYTESMELNTDTNKQENSSVSNEDATGNAQNDNDLKPLDDQNTEVRNMDIDETCGKNSLNLEITTKVSENSDTETIEKDSDKGIDNDQSVDFNPDIIKNTNPSTENNLNHNTVENKNETETISPQKANKSLDFSVTGILNHVTSKNMEIDSKNVVIDTEKDKTVVGNIESTENDTIVNTKQDYIAKNDTDKDNNQFPENTLLNASLNEANDKNSSIKNNSDMITDKNDDTISQNSISNTSTEKNEDSLSLNSLKYTVDDTKVYDSDKFNVNDLSEDEKKLMAELDEQIGETNDKINKLNDGRELQLENFNDGYNFD